MKVSSSLLVAAEATGEVPLKKGTSDRRTMSVRQMEGNAGGWKNQKDGTVEGRSRI